VLATPKLYRYNDWNTGNHPVEPRFDRNHSCSANEKIRDTANRFSLGSVGAHLAGSQPVDETLECGIRADID